MRNGIGNHSQHYEKYMFIGDFNVKDSGIHMLQKHKESKLY